MALNSATTSGRPIIKLVAVIEAATVTGPAKTLIDFCRRARVPIHDHPELPVVEASLVTFHRGQPPPNGQLNTPFADAVRHAQIDLDVVWERFRYDPRAVAQLREIFARRAPDIIQTQGVKSHFLVRTFGLSRSCRWIAFHNGYTSTDLKMLLYNQLDRWSVPSAGQVVTVCQAFKHALARRGVKPERISVLRDPAPAWVAPDPAAMEALRTRLRLAPGQRVILAVGRLSREKGHIHLVRALDHLRRAQPDLSLALWLVGDGPERPRLEDAVRALNLQELVRFEGHQNCVAPYYALADVLALPSHSEGTPNVLLEAASAKLPVVATAVGGVPEVVTDQESALLVPSGDEVALARAILRILSDEHLARRLASAAAAHVAAHHSPEAYHRAMVELYSSLLPEVGPR